MPASSSRGHGRRQPSPRRSWAGTTSLVLNAALFLSVLGIAPSASADDSSESESPAALFSQGQAEFHARRFGQAARLFERADQIRPASQAAYNAALAWDASGESVPAANAFVRALDRGELSADEEREASRRLVELSMALGKISVVRPPGARVRSGKSTVVVPGTLYVAPGSHQLACELPDGRKLTRQVAVRSGQSLELSLLDPPKPRTAPTPAIPTQPRKDEAVSDSSDATRVLGFGALGLGAVALGGGIWLNTRGISANSSFEDSGRTDLDARDRALELRTAAFVTYGAAAVFAGVGTILILSSSGERSAHVRVSPGRVALTAPF